VPLLLILLLLPLAFIVLIPFSLVQRYRVGTSRRTARGWVAALNLIAIALSVVFFLTGAALTSLWVPQAFLYSAAGIAAGGVLGLLGLLLTRWEAAPGALFYTPNRPLVLGITLIVSARILYGLWRVWETWRLNPDETSWVVASGVAGSLAAGGVVLGYYFAYWMGVRARARRAGVLNRR
jgi:uncharacterized membrane protein